MLQEPHCPAIARGDAWWLLLLRLFVMWLLNVHLEQFAEQRPLGSVVQSS